MHTELLPTLAGRIAAEPRIALLLAMLAVATWTDARTFRIPNWLTYGGALLALISAAASGLPATLTALAGLAVGLAALLPLRLLRLLGAGDVKLMAAAGAFLGPVDVLYAVVLTFVAGGVLALAWSLWQRRMGRLMRNLHGAALAASLGHMPQLQQVTVGRLPYGIAICIGTFAWLAIRLMH